LLQIADISDNLLTHLHPRNMLYHASQGSSAPGKLITPLLSVSILAISTR